jgi:peroxiredoxin
MSIGCSRENSVLHDAKGHEITISQLKGKWIIVNYWAAWCASCLKEIPELNHFYQRNHHKNIVLFGVNYDRLSLSDLQQTIDKTHIAFPVVLEDPAQIWLLNGIEALPVTFIIDPQGKVVKRIVGASTEQSLLATLRELTLRQSI